MNTVFQLGNSTIVKDMIFGWCIGNNGLEGNMYAIMDIPIEVLQDLATAVYPVYLHDFEVALGDELKFRKEQATQKTSIDKQAAIVRAEDNVKEQMKVDDLRPFTKTSTLPRLEDRVKLMSLIMSKTLPSHEYGGITVADIGYVRVDNLGDCELPWRAVNTNGSTPWSEQFATVDEVIDRLLARYW